ARLHPDRAGVSLTRASGLVLHAVSVAPGVRWSGGLVVWWSGGLVVWWSGGLVVWWSGGLVVWWSGGRVVGWSGGRVVGCPTVRLSIDNAEWSGPEICTQYSVLCNLYLIHSAATDWHSRAM